MEKTRQTPVENPDGLDFEGAKVFMKKVLELVLGLPNEFYVMGSEIGDLPVVRPSTFFPRTPSSMISRMWQSAARAALPGKADGQRGAAARRQSTPVASHAA